MANDFDLWEDSLDPHPKLTLVGDDLGEKGREVKGEALTEDDADSFATILGVDD
jgi:hypothetical protein